MYVFYTHLNIDNYGWSLKDKGIQIKLPFGAYCIGGTFKDGSQQQEEERHLAVS